MKKIGLGIAILLFAIVVEVSWTVVYKTTFLYTTGCPRCEVLKKKLDAKSIQYIENNSVEEMTELGITHVPMLKCDGWLMDFKSAVEWVNEQQEVCDEHYVED